VPASGKILRLSHGKIAAILAATSAILSFLGMIWIRDRPEAEPAPSKPQVSPALPFPVLPMKELPQTGLEELGTLPPFSASPPGGNQPAAK